jgi:hypothetical protein
MVVLDRKHSKVSETVKNNVCEYNRTDMAGKNLRTIHSDFFFSSPMITIAGNGNIKEIPHRLQFLGLPLDVNSL